MKKLAILACVCMALVFSSCHREQHTYNAAVTYHFADHDNEVRVDAILKSFSSFWEGDYTWKGNNLAWADAQADIRFTGESVAAITLNFNSKLAEYFEEGDYFIYTLTRKDDNTKLHEYKFTKDGGEETFHIIK